MKRHLSIAALTLLGAAGCGQAVKPPATAPVAAEPSGGAPAEPVAEAAVVAAEPPPSDGTIKPASDGAPAGPEAEAPGTAVAARSNAESAADVAAPTAEQTVGQVKRLLIYTPSGPIVAEFALRIDGRGATEMNDAFVDELLKAADANQDGETSWMEALSSQRSGIPQFIGEGGGNAQEFYDRDRDGVVDRSELWNLLGHGEAGLAFRLDHVDGPGGATTASEVARLLDTDGDRVLSLAEIEQAPAQLRLADANDDERLTADELGPPSMGMPQAAMSSAMGDAVVAASILDEDTDWGVIHYELDERYLMHGQFRNEQLPLFPELSKKLDADGNGVLNIAEAEILNYLTPHLRFEIDFGSGDAGGGRLKVVDMRSEFSNGAQQRATERSVQFDWPNLTLAFSAADHANAGDVAAQADATFMQADQDKNGYLEKSELPEPQQASFEGWDADADGKLYLDELKEALRAERTPLLNRVRVTINPGEHSLLAALDADRNGALSAREIQESAKRLRAGDRDGDGRLTKDEIPTRIDVHIERGPGAGPGPAVDYSAPIADAAPTAPRWFQHMDSNTDGDISPREFLGAPETFQRLDTDADGLLSLAEATADSAGAP